MRLEPPTIPEPLINSLPMTVAVRLPENFDHYVHQEEVLGREEWTIDLGASNAVFFTQLFKYMFDEVIVLEPGANPTDMAIDALIEPSIDAFEFSVPNQTKTDSFAVWIRYRIRVFDRDGDLVLDAPVSAYGKSLTTALGGDAALQRAAVLAMRDAAALMIMKFDEQTLFTSLADPSVQVPSLATGSDEEAAVSATALGGKDE
ncbi:MAG: hypothetical protein QNJ00_12765 [Woeseiaceae bacterium]|nr:hypothetical protein [Woeseiaceae bacterium]